ncbi:SET and MYND domain-containing protein 4-like isoform X2 [Limulus polyphemus]|nr:SET and MYND domain-containing protein 4-like isoform X2 [Limulus polyphemus]XP_022244903.1 SET and MYND domain-containing protein 4-like isoform X2 [Limulus polyphemus]
MESSWQDVLNVTTYHLASNKELGLRWFSQLRSNKERVQFCFNYQIFRNKLSFWLNVICGSQHKKHWEKASELRVEGNRCFHDKDFGKAVECYTQSILSAPFPRPNDAGEHHEELALGFANRSAALFHLHMYKECLKDIERAFQQGYPQELSYKLYQRKGMCLHYLNDYSYAKRAFSEALHILKEGRLDTKKMEIQKKEIQNLLKLCETPRHSMPKVQPYDCDDKQTLPDISYGRNSNFPSASSAVDVQCNKEKGRHVVANRMLSAGDTIFVETPYASVLLPNFYTTNCHHCYDKLVTAVPCHQCSQVRYCSEHCCKESWVKYHKWECGNLDLLHSVGIAHLAFRIILVTGMPCLSEFLKNKDRTDDQEMYLDTERQHCIRNYLRVYHLVTHSREMYVEDNFQYALTAALLLLLLKKVRFFCSDDNHTCSDGCSDISFESTPFNKEESSGNNSQDPSNNSDFIQNLLINSHDKTSLVAATGGLCLRHIQQLVCNASAITQLQTFQAENETVLMEKQVRVATAFYPSSSLMNHSCDPNIITSFHKDKLIVRVVKKVSPGGEVYNCYGPHFRRMSREDRQKALIEQYFFVCKCEACEGNGEWENKFQALRCNSCEGPLRPLNDISRTSCIDCDREQDCAIQQQKLFAAHDLFIQGLQLAEKKFFKDALEKLQKCHKIREKLLYKHHKQLAEVRDKIAWCYSSLGEFWLAVGFLRPTLVTTSEQFGAHSIEIANELQKFSDLLLNAIPQLLQEGHNSKESFIRNVFRESHEVISRAVEIFSIHYGSHHVAVKELKEKEKQLEGLS